jgi:dTDP-4-amino-4,6-dideoxygalactose transaminase/glycosyltransferase involved in cell wall biosynthesis/SAM-dependent methyltransferase
MRIGYVVNDFPALSETFIRREILALCERGEMVFVYAHYRHHDPRVADPVHPRLVVRQVPFLHSPAELAQAIFQDCVEHLHGTLMADAQFAAWAAARELSIPFTITAYSGYSVFAGQPLLYQGLSCDELCGGVIVEDPFMRDWVVDRLGVDAGKTLEIANSFDLGEYRRRGPKSIKGGPRILSIARFVPKKGLTVLIEAFRILQPDVPGAELWLIGDGPEEARLHDVAQGAAGIRFLGAQPEARCREAYEDCDVFCLPCVRTEDGDADGIPTTVLEAMALEMPVVISDLLSASHYVRPGQEGLLAKPGDPEDVANCLRRLCHDAGLRSRMGRVGRARVEALCDLGRNIERLRDLFQRARRRRWRTCMDRLQGWRGACSPQRRDYYNEAKTCAAGHFALRPGRLLEVGCGNGSMRYYLPRGVEYFGCDPAPVLPDCREMPFDYVLFYAVLSYLFEPETALDEAVRVLKPGGRLLVSECANDLNPLHLNHQTYGWIVASLSARLRLLDHRPDGENHILASAEKPAPVGSGAEAAPRPLVSVAVTAFNRERFLPECLDSILNQTYCPIEVIVVDDGSDDGTRDILERYGDRVRVCRHERNMGVATAKNSALRMTSSEARYVALLDSDDRLHPDFVRRCVRALEDHPDSGVVYVNEILTDESGHELYCREDEQEWMLEEWLRTRNLRGDGWMGRREIVMGTDLHEETMPMDVDYDLFYQLLEVTNFHHVAEPLLYVRHHQRQLTSNVMAMARSHAANLVKYGYSPEYAYLRAARNPEWTPAIEEGITLGRRLRDERERRKRRAAGGSPGRPAIDGGRPVRGEYLVFGAPSLGAEEIEEVTATLRSGWIGTGPRVDRFEGEFAGYVGAENAVALNSCTSGLFLALSTLGAGPGDEVITTPLTFAATANVIEHVGARPVFADIDPETLNLDPEAVERAITPRTRAIMAVHFGGLPCDLDALEKVAMPRGIPVIEDAAHAVGARYGGRMIGGGRNTAVFSFYGNKNLTTGEGGMIVTPDAALAKKLRVLRMHGMESGAWEQLLVRGQAPPELVAAGYKFNMPDLAAALGLPQLRKQESLLAIRQKHARRYDQTFRGLPLLFQPRPAGDGPVRHSLHLYVVQPIDGRWALSRDRLVEALRAENIGAAVHYRPVHLTRYYRERYGFAEGMLPHAERAGRWLITLPLTPSMSDSDVDDVIEAVGKLAAAYAA